MRVALAGLGFACRHSFARDNLAGVTSIHFARWVPLDDGERLIFASSYDGSLESYMDDFISRLAWGINLVFSNGVGFPKARWLVLGGARDEIRYKHYLRRHQVPTPVFYSAYPELTAPVLDRIRRRPQRHQRARRGECADLAGAAVTGARNGGLNDQLELDDIQGLVARGYGRLPMRPTSCSRSTSPGPRATCSTDSSTSAV